MPAVSLDDLKSPVKKLLRFFQRSRNQWKAKHGVVKASIITWVAENAQQ